MKLSTKLALAVCSMSVLTVPVAAHHSYSMFDMTKTVVLDAKVVQFRWQNPHAFIRVEVPVGNEVEQWSIEMTSPNNLVQEGWTRTMLRTGDRVELYVHPLRSGARGGAYAGIRLADGRTLGTVEE
ncbi:DUF6152 family protein [Alteraurantiacibacter aquimixticola]|uniref:Copper-binding protein n=1 Tax=Alteraurantiacibacter aquimixticola TaxID=2489173 RepID=A0A4T3FA33_9SPHN|nr:DUF6152 family protein [Alteraurantiacibacter aquimixticola]TIX51900.1 hypothetical protein E5222_05530 [Alteraurantiacibacter aquimixticola]